MCGSQLHADWSLLGEHAAVERAVQIHGDGLARWQRDRGKPLAREGARDLQAGLVRKARTAEAQRSFIEPLRRERGSDRVEIDTREPGDLRLRDPRTL